jgi:hypothetical protein
MIKREVISFITVFQIFQSIQKLLIFVKIRIGNGISTYFLPLNNFMVVFFFLVNNSLNVSKSVVKDVIYGSPFFFPCINTRRKANMEAYFL